MKVSSPVGDFPFTVRSIRIRGRAVVIDGAMGAWPSTIEVAPRDVAEVARAVPLPFYVCVAGALTALVVATRRR